MSGNIEKVKQLKDLPSEFSKLSSLVTKASVRLKNGYGDVYALSPYPAIQLKYVDFNVKGMEFSAIEEENILTLNFCFSGRYEMFVPDNKYIYVSAGIMNIDVTPPLGRVIYTVGNYSGIEILIDLEKIKNNFPASWLECGIDFSEIIRLSKSANGSCLVKTTSEWNILAKNLTERITKADITLEDYRFLVLQLLWVLLHNQTYDIIANPMFLTLGQRAVALRTEERITADLRKRYIISDMAEMEGVSPSSLKKYFSQVYGKSISAYLKEKRVEKSKELLEAGRLSIAEIANEIGYENQSKFGVMFKQETDITPFEYKRRFCYEYSSVRSNP